MRIAPHVVLTRERSAKLEAYARGRKTPARVVLRRLDRVAGRRRHARSGLQTVFHDSTHSEVNSRIGRFLEPG
jgi:hypothetical protein